MFREARTGVSFRDFILGVFIIAAGALIQNTDFLTVASIKPNLSLSFLISFSFFFPINAYLFLVAIGLVFLTFQPGFELLFVAFAVSVIGVFILRNKLPGKAFLNVMVLTALATAFLYLLGDAKFLYTAPITVIKEMVYNVLVSVFMYFLAFRLFAHGR